MALVGRTTGAEISTSSTAASSMLPPPSGESSDPGVRSRSPTPRPRLDAGPVRRHRGIANDTTQLSSRRVGVIDLPTASAGPPLITSVHARSIPTAPGLGGSCLLRSRPSDRGDDTDQPGRRSRTRRRVRRPRVGGRHAGSNAQHIPVRAIAHALGMRASDEDMLTDWAVRILQEGFNDLRASLDYRGAPVLRRARRGALGRAHDDRPDDLITLRVQTDVDAEPLDRKHW